MCLIRASSLDYNPRGLVPMFTCDAKDLYRFASCHSRCMSRAFVWTSNDERMSCSHGVLTVASRYVFWSVMTLVCVCECVRAELLMAPY